MRVTRGNQSAKYCTTGDIKDGSATGGGLAIVIAFDDAAGLCARAGAEGTIERARAAASAIAVRRGAIRE